LSAWFGWVFDSTTELDYQEALNWFGLRFAGDESSKQQAWLGADTEAEDGRLMVRRIPRGTPAYEAGLDTGDEIVGFADFRVHPATWDRQLANYQPGDRLSLLLARRGRLVRITATLGREPALAWKLEAGTASPHRAVW